MFDDHPSSKQASLDYTNIDFTCGHIEIFSKGLTHDLAKDWTFLIRLFLEKNKPRNNAMSDDHLVKKQILLDYQNADFI